MVMPKKDAVVLENWIPFPDRLSIRPGATNWTTGFANNVLRLWTYAGPTGAETIWATTDAGVYNATASGAVGAAAIALTNGKTVGTMIATGATNYLLLANGTDTMKQYDGTTWSSIATFGATATSAYSFVETYRQRIYLIKKNTMTLEYLAVNSIAGATTTYELGAIFKMGGNLVALGTWTIDGGSGPDDHLAICTSKGEVAIFAGSDPASASTWAFRGVYYIGRPLGQLPFFKYGGDLLYNSEAGLFPLSRALLTASIDRTQSVSQKVRQAFNDAASAYFSNDGWQVTAQPDSPFILLNVPATPNQYQYIMHPQTGSWSIFNGWNATCWTRKGNELYFGTGTKTAKVTGSSDFGGNIVATMLQAYTNFDYPRNKQVKLIRPLFIVNGNFSYTMGLAQDFQQVAATSAVTPLGSSSAALWGSGVWGTALWSSSINPILEWRSIPDTYSTWKGLYLQVASMSSAIDYIGCDMLVNPGGTF